MTGPSTQHVYFDRDKLDVCWADVTGDQTGCDQVSATDIGLCRRHYEQIFGGP